MFETLLGVIALAVLFGIRKYLSKKEIHSLQGGFVVDAEIDLKKFCEITGAKIPQELGKTLREVISVEFKRLNRTIREKEELDFEDMLLRINEVEDDEVRKVEIWRKK